jgi:hypothetical protein
VDGANIQVVHYFDHGYLEEENSMIHSCTVAFGANYLTGMVTSVSPSVLLEIVFFVSLKTTKNDFENSNF